MKFSLRQSAEEINPAGALDKIKTLLNPLDYSRFKKTVTQRLSNDAVTALADYLGHPYWIKENNPAAAPFTKRPRIGK